MIILKFGGKSLANGENLKRSIDIIQNELIGRKDKIHIIVSARGNTTDQLEYFLEQAKIGNSFDEEWEAFKNYQISPCIDIDFSDEFLRLEQIFKGILLTGDFTAKTKDLVLAHGELLSAKLIAKLLNNLNIKAKAIDSRHFFITDNSFGEARILKKESALRTLKFFKEINDDTIGIVTGFIAATKQNETTTFGRNGSNYSASLLANFFNAEKVKSYTHVDGIFTANPALVNNAKVISEINYVEANELASFGASILHAKTIAPLEKKNIPLHILNSQKPNTKGTIISGNTLEKGIKSISIEDHVGLINIVGKGLLGKIGIDARIFTKLSNHNISIGIISQGSSERGVSFVVSSRDLKLAETILEEEFRNELLTEDIQSIESNNKISVVTVVGQNIVDFSTALKHLKENDVPVLLINNSINGNNISLVLDSNDAVKAVNIIHSHIFGVNKTINIVIFGKGNVGSTLIKQILQSKHRILKNKNVLLNIFAIVDSQRILLDKSGISDDWQARIAQTTANDNKLQKIKEYADKHHLENLLAIDVTASKSIVKDYRFLIENGFDLISSNKVANTGLYKDYSLLHETLKKHNKHFLYETNVGAGLPIIDTIKLLHQSGENITRIRGVFSGSISYLFNRFSEVDRPFSSILKEAMEKGLTEPDPREDLNGNDVARKLLILARELALENEFDEIDIKNLIPEDLRSIEKQEFLFRLRELDTVYEELKSQQKENHVLRYVADLYGDLSQRKGKLKVALVSVDRNSNLGALKDADTLFEIFTESYGNNPIRISGAGAGAEVTARGVLGDILRIADKK